MSSTGLKVGLVHTVPALGATFDDLVQEQADPVAGNGRDGIEPIHVTDPWLLRTAMTSGVTGEVVRRLRGHVAHLVDEGVAGVLVTCSSLGEATEEVARQLATEVPIVRVDQAMADRAVVAAGHGGRVAVLATVASTVGPTVRLIERSAAQAGMTVHTEVDVLTEAGRARDTGDGERHDDLVAVAVHGWARRHRADVVILAQASMAAAAARAEQSDVPVLSSPELAARRLVTISQAR